MTQEVKGEPCLIQAGGSDVSLKVPEGVHGTITTQTFTDPSNFQHLISDNECIASPIYQVTLDADQTQDQSDEMYSAKIPHNIPDVKKAEEHIRVRQGDSSGAEMAEIKRKKKGIGAWFRKMKTVLQTEPCYDIDKDFITVETRKPGVIIVTLKGLKCCSSSATCYLFGTPTPFRDGKSMAIIKVYFWRYHRQIKDYETVSKVL